MNWVISSQPDAGLKSKNFFYKRFLILSTDFSNALEKMKRMFIWSQNKSFRHNLIPTSNLIAYLTKVSPFYLLCYKTHWAKLKIGSFGHKLSHFITTWCWPQIQKLLYKKFLNFIYWVIKCSEQNEKDVHLVTK